MKTLIPAYGVDYKTAEGVTQAYLEGRDFVLFDINDSYNDGRYCSCENFYGQEVKLRYRNLEGFVFVTKEEEG